MQIYVLNRARETLATTSSIYDDKHTLTLDAGSSSYEFKIDKADEASQYMDSGNYIVLQDDDGKTWLFTILDYEETQYTKTVYAEDAGIELLNKACDIWKADGPHSFEHYFEIVTSGTPWKLGVNQLAGLDRTLKYEGRDTGLGRLLSILKGFDDAECTFDVNVKMNAPSEFKINVYKQVGNDRSDVQMVYNHELNDITKKESRAEFVTALCGVGGTVTPPEGQETTEQENISFADLEYNKDGLVTTKGDKFLRAVDANKRFNPGQTTYIEAFYEYDTQSASELLNRTITRLKTYSEPQYTYTADVKIIDSTLKIGDTVTIIDHDYNPALYLSARVAKLEKSYTDPSQNTIEFCNYRLLSSRLADKLAKLQTIVNQLPSASQVGKLESNVSNLSTKTEELASQITSANGKNTNFYGKTEPANPKNGDLWYKKLENGEIEMYQYQDGTWQLLASTADLTTVQNELDQAKVDMEQAKTDAQTAYDEAIKATNTANGAKAQTAEALEQAKQANDSYTALSKEVADNKASVDADYKQVHDSYTNLAKEVADNKASVDADYQKAQADIAQANASYTALAKEVADNKASVDADYQKVQADVAQANDSYTALAKEVADNKASVDTDIADVRKTIDDNKASADADWEQAQEDYASVSGKLTETNKTVTDIKTSVNGIKTTVADNTGKIATITQTVDSVKTSVANAQGDIATLQTDVSGTKQTVANAQGDITSIQTSVDGVQTDITNAKKDITSIKTDISGVKTSVSNAQGDITSIQTSVDGVQADVENAKGDITSIKTDVNGVKTTVADHTGKITQLTTDVNGVKSTVSSKVDKTTYQSYVTQTDQALSTKLTESDLQGYAKTADVKQTTDGLSASITKVQGDLAYKATTLVDKPEFSDGDVGGWVSNTGDWSSDGEPCVLDGSSTIDGYKNGIRAQAAEGDLYASAYWKPVASGSKWYVEALVPNLEPTGGKTLKANASLYYTRPSDGQGAWTFADCGEIDIAPQHWGWIKGYVTVPSGVTKVKPCISMKNADGTSVVAHVKYCQFTLVNSGVQSQINTLSGKITATSDRLSSVYTKSETDAKLGTKVEQSTLTQTANGLSASIAGNTDKITKLTADVNGVKSTVASKVDNTVYQTYIEQTNQSLSEKLVASDLNGYAKTVDVTKSIDGVKTTVADNTGKITTMQTDVNGIKTNVENAQGDISTLQTDVSGVKTTVADHTGKITQLTTDVNGVKTTVGDVQGNVATLQADAKSIKTTVADHTGKISTVQTDVNGIKTNVQNAQGDISSLQTDVGGVKATVSDHTGKITQLTTDVNGVKSTVSSKVDKTTYQSYVTQTDRALSTKLTASDLQGYAKTTDLETRAGKIEASLTSLQGDMSYKATTLVDKPEFSDGNVGGWISNTGDWSSNGKPCVLDGSATVDGYKNGIKAQTAGEELYANAHWKPVASGSKWYVEALVPNLEPTGGKTLKANASLYYIRPSDGKNAWTFVDCGATDIAPQHWGWIKGYVTVPSGVTKVKPCISMKNADGTAVIAHVKYCQFTLVNTGVQSQLNTLSGKITATSERLSSVYTKSETDAKLGTKVEQSVLTQTSNTLSASIAKNSNILSSIGLTSDTAYINANKIALNGKTLMSNATINDAFIGNLSANKITTGTLNAAKVNVINLDASKITTGTLTAVDIHQSSAGADTWINEDGIHNQIGSNNVWIKDGTLAAFDSSGQGMFMEQGQLTLASFAYWQNAGKPESIDYGVIKCDDDITGKKGIGVIGKGGFSLRTNNSDVNGWTGNKLMGYVTAGAGIIGTDDGKLILGSLKPTFIEGGWRFDDYYGLNNIPFVQVGGKMAKAGSDIDENGSSIVINAWDIKLNACGKDNRNIILNRLTYNGEHTINLNDSTSDLWWGPKMHAPSFVNTSALSKKMNITKLDTQTAINAIKNTDIYDYQFKEFGETGKHYASLIIDDVNDKPQYKAAGAFVDGLGRDDGTQLGYLTVVVQNLLEEIDILKERIDK